MVTSKMHSENNLSLTANKTKSKKFRYMLIVASALSFGQIALADTTTASIVTHATVTQASTTTKSKQKTTFLFVVEAKQATISKAKNGYVLTLSNVDPKILYFSDRPQRIAGYRDTKEFIASWTKPGSSFEMDPPNVALTHAALGTNPAGFAQALPVELKNPQITKNGHIIFTINNVDGIKITTGNFKNVKLFIDNGDCPTCLK